MRSYRFKQLSVNIPLSEAVQQQAQLCPTVISNCGIVLSYCHPYISHCPFYISYCPLHTQCPWHHSILEEVLACRAGTLPICGAGSPLIDPQRILDDPAVLATVKGQLQQQLAEIAELERAQAANAMPRTLEEVNQLEQQLTGALNELRAHRTQLQRSGGARGLDEEQAPGGQGQTGQGGQGQTGG